ncbi:MAG: DNA polymerase III subunit alpha [Proteobacteria bacterium]|nr:DNA polymerase III subunit alpha [Pseudomonadota bacterium]
MSEGFVHLRVHSEFSLADGLVKVPGLVGRVREQGMPAVALTDRANLFALVKFYSKCLSEGVKPIIGVDLQYATAQGDARLTLLAMNNVGYRHLIELVSNAYIGHGERSRVSEADIFAHNEGLLCLGGHADGEIGQRLARSDVVGAVAVLDRWLTVFGDRFYLEVQRTGRPADERHLRAALALAVDAHVPLVATNEVCFLRPEDFEAHESRVCIHESRVLDDPRRERRYSDQQYLKSPAQMRDLFADLPEALDNTLAIAMRCSATIGLGQYFLPNYPIPTGETLEGYLQREARDGLQARIDQLTAFDEYEIDRSVYDERLAYELNIINQMGFPGYFLIVMEFIAWAKQSQIPVGPGRGSGAGSLVAYSLGITDLDPIYHDLLFERFLNPERVSMPDFDVDFCMEGRDAVIQHVSERYGVDSVSQIITFGTMAAKAVVRDVARVQGKPYGLADRLSKLIPGEPGMTLAKAVEQVSELRAFIEENEEVGEIMEMAYQLEGIVRNVGRHAGGVVIAPSALTEFVPLYVDEMSSGLVSQFDKDDVEQVGLVKFDFLGLKTLTVIDWAVRDVNATLREGATPLVTERLPMDDPETFELLKAGDTTGVFQLESRGMKDLIRRLKPDNFNDIVALVALFRPGPLQSGADTDYINRKQRLAKVEYPHPSLEPVLNGTYGVVLYQEQVMQIAQVLAGFSLGQADLLRRAMGKKKPEEMAKVRQQFLEGTQVNNVNEKLANEIFDLMEKFAGYAFNKSHSATYAMVSLQTAYLKCHYPAQFMAATLSADMQNIDKVVTLVDEVRRMNLHLLPPSVNVSAFRFSARENAVVYGLGAVRGVGEGPVSAIIEARELGGAFRDLTDFCARLEPKKINKRVVDALIRSGAMDELAGSGADDLGVVRARLLAQMPSAMQGALQSARDQEIGITDMFGDVAAEPLAPVPHQPFVALSEKERLEGEKDTLGLYLTGHPIEAYLDEIAHFGSCRISDARPQKSSQVFAGLVVSARVVRSRRGDMGIVTLDDRSGRMEVSMFSDVYAQEGRKLVKDSVIVVEGETSNDEFSGTVKLRAERVYTMVEARQRFSKGVRINFCDRSVPADLPGRLQRLLTPYRVHGAGCLVGVDYSTAEAVGCIYLGPHWRVQVSDELLLRLAEEFGQDRVSLKYA